MLLSFNHVTTTEIPLSIFYLDSGHRSAECLSSIACFGPTVTLHWVVLLPLGELFPNFTGDSFGHGTHQKRLSLIHGDGWGKFIGQLGQKLWTESWIWHGIRLFVYTGRQRYTCLAPCFLVAREWFIVFYSSDNMCRRNHCILIITCLVVPSDHLSVNQTFLLLRIPSM